jgi:pSer/pThr/pTyr-binding forkhead associated (FHA) protein
MKSVFGGNGRTYYMLVHKVSSKYHKAGESQPIIVDEIEIGRDPRCQVRFDDSFTTVSRRHAAIVRDGERWKLIQLSQTNSTYLNGHHVHKEWYLQNGDEIQLSTNGPKLGFIIPEGEKGKVSSIGLTARLNLFRKQALRPYKTALTILSCVLLMAIAGLVWMGIHTKDMEKEWETKNIAMQHMIDSLNRAAIEMGANNDTLKAQIEQMKIDKAEQDKTINNLRAKIRVIVPPTNGDLLPYEPYVYYIRTSYINVYWHDGGSTAFKYIGWRGTGFMLEDGTFVTARHVSEAWYFWRQGNQTDETMRDLAKEVALGGRVVAHFIATSSSGDRFEFTSDQMICTRSEDDLILDYDSDGYVYVPLAVGSGSDWAYMKTSSTKGLKYDSDKSRNLERNTNLTILGFPFGYGVDEKYNEVSPLVTSATVAANGLSAERTILTTNSGMEHGNSGGPVFYKNNSGKLVVVGIVSAIAGQSTGFLVPIANFKK